MIRDSCGTTTGLLKHEQAGEQPCGACVNGERARLLTAERQYVPEQPPSPPVDASYLRSDEVTIARRRAILRRDYDGLHSMIPAHIAEAQ